MVERESKQVCNVARGADSFAAAKQSEDDIEAKISAQDDLDEINPVLLSVMLAAVKEKPQAEGVDEESLLVICAAAIREGTISDQNWLSKKLAAVRQSLGLATMESEAIARETMEPESIESKQDGDESDQPSPMAGEAPSQVVPQFTEIPLAQVQIVSTRDELGPILVDHGKWIAATLDPRQGIATGRANLSGSNLTGFDLSFIDLRGATLRKVNFSGANLTSANLATANLQEANLADANLQNANLRRCALSGANLKGAKLTGAVLRLSDLKGAIYDEEQLAEARLVDSPRAESSPR